MHYDYAAMLATSATAGGATRRLGAPPRAGAGGQTTAPAGPGELAESGRTWQ